jgi:hypothetical protein
MSKQGAEKNVRRVAFARMKKSVDKDDKKGI